MSALAAELKANYQAFHGDWTTQITSNWDSLKVHKHYEESYRRLSCLQALKEIIVVPHFSNGSADFFIEAHNDALISHVSASFGSWRAALQSLRSCLENVLCSVYYRDHPVELRLWEMGEFRLGFSELHRYASKHPDLAGIRLGLTGLETMKSEYATLSKAVHASAKLFRMTDPASAVLLWSTDVSRLGMWAAREKKVLESVCLLVLCPYYKELQGTKLTSLRNMLYYVLSQQRRAIAKSELKVTIPKP